LAVARVLPLFLWNLAWRVLHLETGGRRLVRALAARAEDERLIAGMLLVRGGSRAKPLLVEALRRRQGTVQIVEILPSIEAQGIEAILREFSADPDPLVARTARDGLDALKARAEVLPG
jgi:hypothetical protein